jgi:hypothetical protein
MKKELLRSLCRLCLHELGGWGTLWEHQQATSNVPSVHVVKQHIHYTICPNPAYVKTMDSYSEKNVKGIFL